MSSFTKPLIAKHLDGRLWELTEGFEYYTDNTAIQVPKGFICDFASIPRFAWSIIDHPTGPAGKAAVIHDYLYRVGKPFNRKQSDQIFLEGMEVLKIPEWKRNIMYRFVRIFGFFPWRKYRTQYQTIT